MNERETQALAPQEDNELYIPRETAQNEFFIAECTGGETDIPQQKSFTVEEIEQLTQKLEKAREYLNAIVNGTHFTEDLSGHLIDLAQQALKELDT